MGIVKIRAVRSFMDIREGDESTVPFDATIRGWVDAGLVRVVEEFHTVYDDATPILEADDGEAETGPGSAEPDDEKRESGEG